MTPKDILIKMLERNSVNLSELKLSKREEGVLTAIAPSLDGVKRKNDEDYIVHLLQVRCFTNEILFPDGNIITDIPGTSALLHDEVEDERVDVTYLISILINSGFNRSEITGILCSIYLLKSDKEKKRDERVVESAEKLMKHPIDIAIKVADIKSNTLDVSCLNPEFSERYIQEKITQLFIMLLAIRGIKYPTEQHESIKKAVIEQINFLLKTQWWKHWGDESGKTIDDEWFPFFSQVTN